jgi:hypothetical protein
VCAGPAKNRQQGLNNEPHLESFLGLPDGVIIKLYFFERFLNNPLTILECDGLQESIMKEVFRQNDKIAPINPRH